MSERDTSREEAHARTMELLREVRLIEVQTSRLVDEHLAGSYQSAFKGQGISFSEVRAYEPGDDVRAIDWNVTARTGEPHIKVFTEEREMTVLLLVDMSGSLDLGSRDVDKRHLVARLVATFAFSATRNNDRVGLIGFTDEVEVFVPPRSGRKHVLSVVSRVLQHRPRGRRTRPAVALEAMARLKGHAVVVLISDFIDGTDEPAFERALKMVRRRHDVIPVRVEDPLELELPPLGLVAVEDLELLGLGRTTELDLSRRRVKRYNKQVEAERLAFEKLMRKLSLPTLDVRCGEDWRTPLVGYFKRRARRARR